MIPTQEHPGQYWRSSDPADIWLNEAGAESPTLITCQTPQGGTATVHMDNLKFIGAGLFWRRPSVLAAATSTGRARATVTALLGSQAIQRSCGCDPTVVWRRCEGVMLSSTNSVETWEHLAATSKPEMLWNICHELYEATS